MSDISHRRRKAGALFPLLLLFLAAIVPAAAGCLPGEKRRTFSPQEDELLRAKADPRLRREAETGGSEPFAAIAVYRNDVFLDQSEAFGRSSLTVLNELGGTAILLLPPGGIVPLLKDPSLRKAAWFGPQELLARLDPSLELDLLTRFGAGTEDRDVPLLLRFVDVGGAVEERNAATAGFRIVTRAGPTWVVVGPMSGLPRLLESDRIIYVEKAPLPDDAADTGDRGVTVTKEVPHSKETISEIRERGMTNPLPEKEDRSIHSHKIPRSGNDNVTRSR